MSQETGIRYGRLIYRSLPELLSFQLMSSLVFSLPASLLTGLYNMIFIYKKSSIFVDFCEYVGNQMGCHGHCSSRFIVVSVLLYKLKQGGKGIL